MTRRHPSQLVDTGERKAIADVVRDSVEDIFENTPSPGISMDTAKIIAQDACKEYHRDHCPAKSLGEKVEDLSKDFAKFRLDIAEWRGETRGQFRLVLWAVPLLVTVAMLGVTATWKIAERTQVVSKVHAAQIETKDAGR